MDLPCQGSRMQKPSPTTWAALPSTPPTGSQPPRCAGWEPYTPRPPAGHACTPLQLRSLPLSYTCLPGTMNADRDSETACFVCLLTYGLARSSCWLHVGLTGKWLLGRHWGSLCEKCCADPFPFGSGRTPGLWAACLGSRLRSTGPSLWDLGRVCNMYTSVSSSANGNS